jgi:hypothetical protein
LRETPSGARSTPVCLEENLIRRREYFFVLVGSKFYGMFTTMG